MAKIRNRNTATPAATGKASDGGLVLVANNSARLITINLPRKTTSGSMVLKRIRLVPGINMVDSGAWAVASELDFVKNHTEAGNLSLEDRDVKKAKEVSARAKAAEASSEESNNENEEVNEE